MAEYHLRTCDEHNKGVTTAQEMKCGMVVYQRVIKHGMGHYW